MTTQKPKAPCGHDGEYVIGTYVRCLQGCSKDPHVAPPKVQPKRRGTPGHVDMCACKHCTVRRRGRTLVLRTADGKQTSTTWDGVTDNVRFRSNVDGDLRHWKLLDEDGDVLVDGMCDVKTTKDEDIVINFNWLVPDKAVLVVTTSLPRPRSNDEMLMDYAMYNPSYDLGIMEAYAKQVERIQKQMAEAMRVNMDGWVDKMLENTAEPKLMRQWYKYADLKSKKLIPYDTETATDQINAVGDTVKPGEWGQDWRQHAKKGKFGYRPLDKIEKIVLTRIKSDK